MASGHPSGYSLHQQIQQLVAAATHLIRNATPGDYLVAREHERGSARQVTTFGVFGPPTAVVCVTDFPPQLHTLDGRTLIRAAGKQIAVPAAALPAVRQLLSGRPADIREITTATGIDAAALAEVLIAERVCAEITPELAEGYAGTIVCDAT